MFSSNVMKLKRQFFLVAGMCYLLPVVEVSVQFDPPNDATHNFAEQSIHLGDWIHLGESNPVPGNDGTGVAASGSIMLGQAFCASSNSIAVGDGARAGRGRGSLHTAMFAFGRGAEAAGSNALVITHSGDFVIPWQKPSVTGGQYAPAAEDLASGVENAFEIRGDGTVIIGKVQGDISMGIFGN